MSVTMNDGLRLANVEQIRGFIRSTCEKVALQPGFTADLTRLKCTVVEAPYPAGDDGTAGIISTMGPKHTVSAGFALGFLAGMLDDQVLASTYEVLLRVLEALGMQGLVYGMVQSPEGIPAGPYFIVQVASTPNQYLRYDIHLD